MRNKFIKTFCSFQIGVNVIGIPLYLEIKGIEKEVNTFFNKRNELKIFTSVTL